MRTSTGAPGGPGRPAEEQAIGDEQRRREHDDQDDCGDQHLPAAGRAYSAARRSRKVCKSTAAAWASSLVARPATGCRRHPSRYRRRQALVLGQDRDSASAAQSGDERLGLDRLRPALAAERERQTDDDHLGRLALDDRTQLGHAALGPDLLDHAQRACERAARIADRDAGARAAVVERERLARTQSRRRAASSASSSRLASLPPARAIAGRPPPPPPTIGADLLDHGGRVEAVLDRLGRHARDELHALAVARAEHDRRRPERAAQAVGELEQRVAEVPAGRLDGEHLEPAALGRTGRQRGQVGPAAVAAAATCARRLLELAHALAERRDGLGQLLRRRAQRGCRLA